MGSASADLMFIRKESTTKRGRTAENHVVGCCRRWGWIVISRNWRCRGGELDIVAWDQEQFIVVEVKCRTSARWGVAKTQLTVAQRRRLYATFEQYCYRHGLGERLWRLDLVALQYRDRRWYSTHYEGVNV